MAGRSPDGLVLIVRSSKLFRDPPPSSILPKDYPINHNVGCQSVV